MLYVFCMYLIERFLSRSFVCEMHSHSYAHTFYRRDNIKSIQSPGPSPQQIWLEMSMSLRHYCQYRRQIRAACQQVVQHSCVHAGPACTQFGRSRWCDSTRVCVLSQAWPRSLLRRKIPCCWETLKCLPSAALRSTQTCGSRQWERSSCSSVRSSSLHYQ